MPVLVFTGQQIDVCIFPVKKWEPTPISLQKKTTSHLAFDRYKITKNPTKSQVNPNPNLPCDWGNSRKPSLCSMAAAMCGALPSSPAIRADDQQHTS